MIYNKDGVEVGKFLSIQSKGEGNAVTIKVSKNGTVLPVRFDFIVPAYMTREDEGAEPQAAPASPPNGGGPTTDAGGDGPRGPIEVDAESLESGQRMFGLDGTSNGPGSGVITDIQRSGNRINVTYTDSNGESRSRRVMEGDKVLTGPSEDGGDGFRFADSGGGKNLITQKQKDALDDIDGQDFIDPITDTVLLADFQKMYNDYQAGIPIATADAAALIKRVQDHYAQRKAPTPPVTRPPVGPTAGRKDDGKDIVRSKKTTEEMRRSKIKAETDADGRVVFDVLPDGKTALDDKGRPIPVEDRASAIAQILADYPDAKVSKDGKHVTVFRRTDVDGTVVEVGISLAHRGKYLVTTTFTKPDGTKEKFQHYDLRDSYVGVHGKTNGIEKMIDIITRDNPENDSKGNDRKTATRGYDTTGRTLYRERFEYFIKQGRMLTSEQTLMRFANGIAEVRNSDGVTIKQKAVPVLWDAYRDKDWEAFRQRFIALSSHLPLDQETVEMVMRTMRSELKKRYPNENKRAVNAAVSTAVRAMKAGVFADRRNMPFIDESDNSTLTYGDWVDYKNNVGQITRGRIVKLDPESLGGKTEETDGSQFLDNMTVEFVDEDGEIIRVPKLTSKHLTKVDTKKEKNPQYGAYKPNLSGPALDDFRGAKRRVPKPRNKIIFPDLELERGQEKAEEAKGGSQSGLVDNLTVGSTFYDKKGNPLGEVVHIDSVTGKDGSPGFVIVYKGEDGELHTKGVKAGEVRGPKA